METTTNPQQWRDLYRVVFIAVIVSMLVILLGLVMYFFWPYAPGRLSTEQIFTLLQSHPFGGMISLDLFLLIGNLFGVFIFLGLYLTLRSINPSHALIALAVGLLGLVLLIPARPLPELLALSKAYAVATDMVEKNQLLAAGTSQLSHFDGIGWFLNTLLGAISLLISSIIMLKSRDFSKTTAWVGIITNFAVCFFFLPVAGKFFLFLSLPGYLIWYFLLARVFYRLGWKG